MFKDKVALKKAIEKVYECAIWCAMLVAIVFITIGIFWLFEYNIYLGSMTLLMLVLGSVFLFTYIYESEGNKEN